MTPTTLALAALAHIYPSNAASNQATLTLASVRQKQWIADDLTAVLQDIYKAAPDLYRRSLGGLLAAPQTISVGVTQGSATFTTVSAFIEGSTIVIDGDTVFNTVRTEGAAKVLLYPYQGSTGTKSAVLYGDSILLASTVGRVLGNVYLADTRRLAPAANKADLYRTRQAFPDYGRVVINRANKPLIGEPNKYYVETFLNVGDATGHASQLRLLVHPLPRQAYAIRYDVKMRAPRIDVDDLGTDADESTILMVVPEDEHESLLRPLFLERWSRSPWFKNDEVKSGLKMDADGARLRLDDYRAQQERNRTTGTAL